MVKRQSPTPRRRTQAERSEATRAALMASGRKVIASPVSPRATNQLITIMSPIQRVNHWIRAYCRGEPWANPNGFNQIALADPNGYWSDGTNNFSYPIGGTGYR